MDPDRTYLAERLRDGEVLALTGAGLSTASGLPDYRGPDGQRRVEPMTIAQFRTGADARRRYWSRSYVGWERFRQAAPNGAHRHMAALEQAGLITATITQNVDGLAQEAGSTNVIELHGNLGRAICLNCGRTVDRQWMQEEFSALNPAFAADAERARELPLRPDGDVDIDESLIHDIALVDCPSCGSDLLKPDVVMFGESVPKETVEYCFALVERARTLLVVGSSLGVMSGYRFARRAAAHDIPVVLVNTGWSRAEELADRHLHRPLQEVLAEAVADVGITDRG
ncbi:Sir2 family NAD-dependent protein deacetylase [Yimella sp. cx-51]|uniref:Sir2 family NAD-dependent protein deacetylase n=1 Tax=Yimella sp. cx-51 TaxID=2770551 RepID=UPI00165E9E8D|nr:Sir2 family NAD-dependent protein deacetylase [Yimella sp. cx-51]MBC9957236.1 NAD-dependent deacetylase [Yimella sp. cx-51]QTH37120.1 NAD-dependent protein deacetylase 1 [Yimella sp. cx-51]